MFLELPAVVLLMEIVKGIYLISALVLIYFYSVKYAEVVTAMQVTHEKYRNISEKDLRKVVQAHFFGTFILSPLILLVITIRELIFLFRFGYNPKTSV